MEKIAYSLFIALFLTCAAEMLPQLFLKERKKLILSGLLCNAITNPLLNVTVLLLYAFVNDIWVLYSIIILLEVVVLFAEAGIYKLILDKPFKICLTVSAVCNAVSFSVGLIWNLIQ